MGEAPLNEVAVFVLAGGKSTRMGCDKAFVEYDGQTLVTRALAVTRLVTSEVRIVGGQEKFARFAPVVEDIFRDCGPLAGIHAALKASGAMLNLMMAVDMPFVSPEFLLYLIGEARRARDAVVVIPSSNGRRQPLCATYRREFAAVAEDALRSGQNRIDRLFEIVPTRTLTEPELEAAGFFSGLFRNLNTPAELEAEKQREREAGRLH